MWDLQRNGGSVAATTERILSGRSLDSVRHMSMVVIERMLITEPQPPPSFQPPMPRQATTAATSNPIPSKPANSDLITRYNLSSRITTPAESTSPEQATSTGSKTQSWSQNKTERAEILKKRREEMVLAARRKMEERDRKAAGAA